MLKISPFVRRNTAPAVLLASSVLLLLSGCSEKSGDGAASAAAAPAAKRRSDDIVGFCIKFSGFGSRRAPGSADQSPCFSAVE